VAETLPGFGSIGWFALMAPPATSEPIARARWATTFAPCWRDRPQAALSRTQYLSAATTPADFISFAREEQ